ncbi:CLIP domain-containing serine protease B15-like [Anopheles bellator]|uniref:CLIP domain-containing serine protease B15-like n=1 Tax=Anopheles bellator TaxID=139047 RepID=UPI0026495BCD|nr:CLIP domain-containing serine protease B15-like [Anopheles bellator]XP_058054683.1 CLIP domain-containing serine protease B15-like [Anopheles bellator]XP_058054684.1 CLIP domain-containing serine protease B15-like [Anopheles bellator]XP_058054685.1 CLIP domain-containing serine protease B15-like [Anopheles bellator]
MGAIVLGSAVLLACAINFGTAQSCGQMQVLKQGLIFGGEASSPGIWPWHVAIFHRESLRNTVYKCGATIINKDTVLTAYHCVVENQRPISGNRLIVRAGVFDLDVRSSTAQENRVFDIVAPDGASALYFTDDIALLRMQTQFVFNDYVQPACIRSIDQDIGQLVGSYGSVVGWGWTEKESTSAELREAKIPVVSADDCLQSNRELFSQVLTTKVFCGGSRNGTSSCNGDSGGGMFFKSGGYWFLRGLTSFSAVDVQNSGICDSRSYVGYTDVAKYLDWLRSNDVRFEDPLRDVPMPGVSGPVNTGNTTLIRLAVDPKMKRFLEGYKGSILLRVQLNGKRVNSLFQ